MSTQHANLPPGVEVITTLADAADRIPAGAEARTIRITLPPSDPGAPPHRHPGPIFGYVTQGEILFELEGQPPRVLKAGDALFEPGGDVIHLQGANNPPDAQSQLVRGRPRRLAIVARGCAWYLARSGPEVSRHVALALQRRTELPEGGARCCLPSSDTMTRCVTSPATSRST